MEIKKQHEAKYRIKSIFLDNSSFNKGAMPDVEKLSMDIGRKYELKENGELVVTVAVKMFLEEDNTFNLSSSMKGIFEFVDSHEMELSVEEFARINAAALIYPYLREHIRWISLQANIKPVILLPVINFYALDQQSK